MRKMLQGAALLLALTFVPLVSASAHDKNTKHRHGRKRGTVTTVHVNHRNPTPGIARRVRRGRNTTPGVRRGPISSTTMTRTVRSRRGGAGAGAALEHKRGHGKH